MVQQHNAAEGFHILKSDASVDHDEYALKILFKYHRFFCLFLPSYQAIADEQ